MIKIKEGFKGERFAYLPDDILEEYSRNPLIRNLYIRKIGFFPHVKYHYVQKKDAITECSFIAQVVKDGIK